MQNENKEIEKKSIALTGLYVAVVSCVIITVIGILSGNDLLVVLLRAVIVLLLAWPTGCFFGYLGFKICEESLQDEATEAKGDEASSENIEQESNES